MARAKLTISIDDKLWEAASGREVANFPAHAGGVHALAVAQDSRTLATGGADGTVKIWDLRGEKPPAVVT